MTVTADWLNRSMSTEYLYTSGQEPSRQQEQSAQESRNNMLKMAADFSDPLSEKLELEYGASVQYITSTYAPETASEGSSTSPPRMLPKPRQKDS